MCDQAHLGYRFLTIQQVYLANAMWLCSILKILSNSKKKQPWRCHDFWVFTLILLIILRTKIWSKVWSSKVRYSISARYNHFNTDRLVFTLPTSQGKRQLWQPKWLVQLLRQLWLTIHRTSSATGQLFYKPTAKKHKHSHYHQSEKLWINQGCPNSKSQVALGS